MVKLYLKHIEKNTEWHEVFVAGGSNIKVIAENPFIKESEQYTLQITIPMGIPENRMFFDNMQHMSVRKEMQLLNCRLENGGRCLISGTAKTISTTENEVKLQLVGGRSEINLKSEEQQLYIDEMELGTMVVSEEGRWININGISVYRGVGAFVDYEGKLSTPTILGYAGMAEEVVDNDGPEDYWKHWPFTLHPAWNESKSEWANIVSIGNAKLIWNQYSLSVQPNLAYVVYAIFHAMGYKVETNCLHRSPWLFLHIASARANPDIAYALPHWTVKEFLQQIELAFCCSFVFDQEKRTVKVRFTEEVFSEANLIELKPDGEYSTEFKDDGDASIFSGNLSFKMSSSDENKYACLEKETRKAIPRKEYETKEEMDAALANMDADEKAKYIFSCKVGGDWYVRDGSLTRIDWFKPLMRDQNGNDKELKICPATVRDNEEQLITGDTHFGPQRILSVEDASETPRRKWWRKEIGGEVWRPYVCEMGVTDTPTAQYMIDNGGKGSPYNADRMELFFNDEISKPGMVEGIGDAYLEPFVNGTIESGHRKWSLSFYSEGSLVQFLGQHHIKENLYNSNTKYKFKFTANDIPDARSLYYIRGKYYLCEKIEADITDGRLDTLMTGYFYEIL